MKYLHKSATTLAITVSVSATFAIYKVPVMAFSVTQNNDPFNLLSNLLGDTTGLSNFDIQLIGDGRAFGTLQNDPFHLGSGVVLSTGRVVDLVGVNTSDTFSADLTFDFLQDGTPTGDSISLNLSFDADDTKDFLFFQYVFGSEEFVEYGGSLFNDNFSLKLNGLNWARLSDGRTVTINNLVPSPQGSYHPDFIYNPVGTSPTSDQIKLDGYTKPLLFKAPLRKNARNTLVINVQDVGDGIYDSVVMIRGGTLGTKEPLAVPGDNGSNSGGGNNGGGNGSGNDGTPVSVPEPASGLGVLIFGGLSILFRLLKKRQ